ncbi:MAG: DUF2065 domain-containing protein [Gammaproteobacteria bacterium]|uniref:DUF2065 domain-containing protein n=1 Tax=OM182 bacterium TaxID=2510334 RepID=A0A520S2U5_9GAMM|nr:DUF2065 domain-containing protein [Gammaproteobacteria bacterium]OUV68720.1 MAG: DUF2065 domain-containing protein [Gammaproteobacteria bacterium TMED133]RZO76776.1 MAG: DUF2065 domain-containing protein [OM182 bacterium]
MWYELGLALCLVLVIEGILPFLFPRYWKKAMLTISETGTSGIRFIGLLSMLIGTTLLCLIR